MSISLVVLDSCFATSFPTLPEAPVIRIVSVMYSYPFMKHLLRRLLLPIEGLLRGLASGDELLVVVERKIF
jgi:hypothetical protein